MYKQPIVPPLGHNLSDRVNALVAFLKDFCMSVWRNDTNTDEEIKKIKERLDALEGGN